MKSLPLLLAFTLLVGAGRIGAQTHSWTVFAGSPTAGSTDGLGAAARLNQPHYLALDGASNLFVTGTGDNTLIVGFAIGGGPSGNKPVLIRGVGPTLAAFNVAGTLTDPKLELFSDPNRILENDDWGGSAVLSTAFASVAAFPLPPDSRDAAILVTLAPGSYTAQVSGVAATTGVALVEVYEIP